MEVNFKLFPRFLGEFSMWRTTCMLDPPLFGTGRTRVSKYLLHQSVKVLAAPEYQSACQNRVSKYLLHQSVNVLAGSACQSTYRTTVPKYLQDWSVKILSGPECQIPCKDQSATIFAGP